MHSRFLDSYKSISSKREYLVAEVAQPIGIDMLDLRILGTWKGEFCGDVFILNFSTDGIMSEASESIIKKYNYCVKDDKLIIMPSVSDINCVFGEELTVCFKSNDSIIIIGDLWEMEMIRNADSELTLP